MNLKKNEIDLQFLATQLIDDCPPESSSSFQNGFLDFLQAYFLHLDCCSAPFANSDGSFDVDMEIVIDYSLDIVSELVERLPKDQVKDYWLGVMTAHPLAEKKLKLAYDSPCEFKIA